MTEKQKKRLISWENSFNFNDRCILESALWTLGYRFVFDRGRGDAEDIIERTDWDWKHGSDNT